MDNCIKKLFLFYSLCCIGCSCGHHPEKATISDPLPMENTLEKALNSSQFAVGEWPSRLWWEVFDDPQLSNLIEKAIKQNPTIQKVQARLIVAEQNAKKVRSALFPTLNADYMENWQYYSKNGFVRDFYAIDPAIAKSTGLSIPSKANTIDLSLNFFYEFDFWGRNLKKYRAALGEAKADLADRIQSELSISTLVAFAYFELQTHKAEELLEQNLLDSWKISYDLILKQDAAGLKNKISGLDAEREVYNIEQKLSETRNNIEIDLYMLKALTAEWPDATLDLAYVPLHFERPIPLPDHLGADLLARRADLMAMIWRAEAASLEIGVAKTDFYPNINLAAFAGLESLQFPTLFSWSSRTGALQPAIHLPIFTGGSLYANLSSKIAKFNEAVATYNEGLLDAAKEVASEMSTLYSLHDRIQLQGKVVSTRKDKELLYHQRFEKGLDDYVQFLVSYRERVEEQINKVELESFKMLSVVRLIKSLGGGYLADDLPSIVEGG